MPILDPQLMLTLLQNEDPQEFKIKTFLLWLLKMAAKNLDKNQYSVESCIQFRQTLSYSTRYFEEEFDTYVFLDDDVNNPTIDNIYQHIYDKIKPEYKAQQNKDGLPGTYFSYNSELKFFQPSLFNDFRSWFFTETSVAILCIRPSECVQHSYLMRSFGYEVDLLMTSGFSVVACILVNDVYIESHDFIELLKNHRFSEVHFLFDVCKDKNKYILENFLGSIDEHSDVLEGNYYIYIRYFDSTDKDFEKVIKLLKKLKKNSFIKIFNFSKSPIKAIKNDIPLKYCKKFAFCKSGFESKFIFVSLSNIPLFESDDEIEDMVPSQVSGFTTAYMSSEDFNTWNFSRVKVLFGIEDEYNDYTYKYANFEDIHSIRIDSYVRETLYLTKTHEDTLKSIDMIIDKLEERIGYNEEFKKETAIFSFIKDKKIQKFLSYVSFAYTKFQRERNPDFFLYKTQVFTAFEACRVFLADTKKQKGEDLGVIYQVETGEGKSCIICLIASLLALMKKTVHITSSNISLANRDYHESFKFFQQLGLKSAVLLHFNELPVNLSSKKRRQNNDSVNIKTNDNEIVYKPEFYPDEYFKESLFNNSSNMNFAVCGINEDNTLSKEKANVVFSTFVNFESLYLKLMEICPGFINKFFKDCSLIIDEADSILIDELTNGTILSRSMKTNGNEVLKFVYQSRIKNKSEVETYNEIIRRFPKCNDMKIEDIKDMYSQIDLVNQNEFQDGKKYSIETIEVKEKVTMKSLIRNSKESLKNVKENKELKKKHKKDDKTFSKHMKRKKKICKQIVPFDYDHKGVLEPNKEFSGFVQQFIAIKEMMNNYEENKNMLIKEVSMNYLYVSHPIFVSLYGAVCGFTGTIGNKYDKLIFNEQYHLSTKKIPRQKPNQRIEFPIILCDSIKERNDKIALEIIELNKKEFPVLVIFQDLNEISTVYKLLSSKGIKNINVFDGKNEKIKPDLIAGLKGTVSLGTNVCGRGTDIKKSEKPLHVIITYFSSNTRVMNQAFGRTARQGKEGSARIICLQSQYVAPIGIFNTSEMKNILDDFQFKNDLQRTFIEKFREKRRWIFDGLIESQKLTDKDISKLREVKININRIKVFNFEFPICMSISTFLIIQAQKIFSLYNCPNCKYTWMLFQKYIREMILESWSLFIEKVEKKYVENEINTKFSDYIKIEYKNLCGLLKVYLPDDSNNPSDYEIVPTFMYIFNYVRDYYESKIIKTFPDELTRCLKQAGNKTFCSFTVGFKPYSLLDDSGARINILNGEEQEQTFIQDPELQYFRKQPHHRYSLLSITEKIDGIFNMICQKINELIGSYIGLKFFLRRTLGGCEFGICFDFDIENKDNEILNDNYCIVDKDPLLMFTISVKSMVPILAGILIIGLVYIASVSKTIFEWISSFGTKALIDIATKTVKEVAKKVFGGQIEKFCSSICAFLQKQLNQQIEKIKQFNSEMAKLFTLLLKIALPNDFSQSRDLINEMFKGKFNISMNFIGSLIDDIPINYFLKIGFLLMLCFASFMVNFHHNRSIKYDSKKVAAEYDEEQNTQNALDKNQRFVEVQQMDVLTVDFNQ